MSKVLIAASIALCCLGCGEEESSPSDDAGAGLDDLFGDLVPDRDEYVFLESCPATDDLEVCSDCCEAEGFDSAAVYGMDCGCQSTETNDTDCNPSAGSDACSECCTALGYNFSFYFGDETTGECSCTRTTTEPNPAP